METNSKFFDKLRLKVLIMKLTEEMLKEVSQKFRAVRYEETLVLIRRYFEIASEEKQIDAQCYLYYIATQIHVNMANEMEVQKLFEHYEKLIHHSISPLEQLKFKHMLAVVQLIQHHQYDEAKQILFQLLKNMEDQQFVMDYPNIYISIYANLMECFIHLEEGDEIVAHYNRIDRIYVHKLLHLDATIYFSIHSILAQHYIEQNQLITAEMIVEDCLSLPEIEDNDKYKGTFLILNSILYALRNDYQMSNALYEEAMTLVSTNVSRRILNELSNVFAQYL